MFGPRASDDIWERLAQITGRDGPDQGGPERGGQSDEEPKRGAQERLQKALDKDQGAKRDVSAEGGEKPSIRERLDDVLNKSREKQEIEDERDQEKDQEVEKDREFDRGPTHGL